MAAKPSVLYEGAKVTMGPGAKPAGGSTALTLAGAPALSGNTNGGDVDIGSAQGSGSGRNGVTTFVLPTADPAVTDAVWNMGGMHVTSGFGGLPWSKEIVCSGEAVVATVATWSTSRLSQAVTLTDVRASLTVLDAKDVVIVDIKHDGKSIFDTSLLTIDKSSTTSVGSKAPYKFATDGTVLADNSVIAVSVTKTGGDGAGLKVNLIGKVVPT